MSELEWTVGPDDNGTLRIDSVTGLILARRLDPDSVLAFADRARRAAMSLIEAALPEGVSVIKVANPNRSKVE